MDPKDSIVVIGQKKGTCYISSADLEKSATIQVLVPVPLVKMKRVVGRSCIGCAKELRALVDLRISQAEHGEYQA